MLNALRSSSSNIFVWIVILLLIVGLAGFGIGTSGGSSSALAVASVGDEEVTVDEYVSAFNLESRRIGQQVDRLFSVEEMRAFGLDQQVMSQLLNSAAIDNEARKIGVSVGDGIVRDALLANPAFAGADGSFDDNAYQFALSNANLTPESYDNVLRDEATREIIRQGIVRGVRTPDTAAKEILQFMNQRRSIAWVRLTAADLDVPVGDPSEEELVAYHSANEAAFTLPETRKITYAYITEDDLMGSIEIPEAAIEALYVERSSEFSAPERRIVDRIVFGTQEEAQLAIDAVSAGTSGFDEIASDRGLTLEDIDLGEVSRSELSTAAADLLFATDDLGVFGPVASDLGPAIYRVNAALDATTLSLEDARPELNRELAQVEAARQIGNATDDIADLLAGGATLEELANETILNLGTIDFSQDSEDDIAASAAFREEAMDAEESEHRDIFDLDDGIAVLRIDEIVPPTLQPLDDVRPQVVDEWRAQETVDRLSDLGASLKTRIDGGEQLTELAAELDLVIIEEAPLGRNDIIEDTPPEFVRDVFSAEQDEGVVVPDANSVLIANVTDIIPAVLISEEDDAQLTAFKQSLSNDTAGDLFLYFTEGLQDSAGLSVNQSLVNNVLGQLSNSSPSY